MDEDAPIEHTLDQFASLVGETFTIEGIGIDIGASLPATLVEARSLREAQGAGLRSRQFSLVWRASNQRRLEQRIYAVRHPALGRLELFLVPLGPDAEGMRYEAVFT